MSRSAKISKHEIPVLTQDNYPEWKGRCRLYLELKGYWPAVMMPAEALDMAPEELKEASLKAKSIIGLSVSKHHLNMVLSCANANEAWTSLQKVFEPQIAGRAIKLQRELANMRMLPDEPVDVYFGRARDLYADLQLAGVPVSENQVVTSAITGLPSRFDTIAVYYQQQQGILTFTDVQAAMITHEAVQAIRDQNNASEQVAFSAHSKFKPEAMKKKVQFKVPTTAGAGTGAGGVNNTADNNDRVSRRGNNDRRSVCYHCGKPGHHQHQCWDLHPNLRPVRNEGGDRAVTPRPSAPLAPVAFVAGHTDSRYRNCWLLDSACERHTCNNGDLMTNLRPVTGQCIRTLGGAELPVTAVGTVTLECESDEPGVYVVVPVHHVALVPTADSNLLSVAYLARQGCTLNFTDKECIVFAKCAPERPMMRAVCLPGTAVYAVALCKEPDPEPEIPVVFSTAVP